MAQLRRKGSTVAHKAVAKAIETGTLPPPRTCKLCGVAGSPFVHGRHSPATRVRYHHWSYLPEHRLDVAPLCDSCHKQVHRGHLPDPTSGVIWAHRIAPGEGERALPFLSAIAARKNHQANTEAPSPSEGA